MLRVQNPELELEVMSEFEAHTQGMFVFSLYDFCYRRSSGSFLWVYFQLEKFYEASSGFLFRKVLCELPLGLAAT